MNKNKFEDDSVSDSDIDKCYTVYMHISPSGKRYIGITRQRPVARWKNGRGYINNEYFYRAIKKYGWDNIEHQILYNDLTKEEAEQKEIELISYYRSDARAYGYNIDHGGHSIGRMSDETKAKLSASHMCVNTTSVDKYSKNGEFIKTYDSVIAAANKHDVSYVAISACCRNVLKSVSGFVWRYHGDELTSEHLEWCNSNGIDNLKIPVCQYTLDGEFVGEYESAEFVGKTYGFNAVSIRKCCKCERRTSGGYIWQYANVDVTDDYVAWCNNAIEDKKTAVSQYSLSGELIKTFNGMIDALNDTGVNQQSIWSCCNNLYKTAGGYIWRYADSPLTKEYLEWCRGNTNAKRVVQYSKDNEFISYWDNAKAAGISLNIGSHDIRACCRGARKSAGGYIWRYADDN